MLKTNNFYPALVQYVTHAAVALEQAFGKLDEKQSAIVVSFALVAVILAGTMIEGPFLRVLPPALRALLWLLIRAPEMILNKILSSIVEALIWFWLAILTGVSWLS